MNKALMSVLDENEKWVAEYEPIFTRDNQYYFFQRGSWIEAGPFESLEDCLLSLEAYTETSDYL